MTCSAADVFGILHRMRANSLACLSQYLRDRLLPIFFQRLRVMFVLTYARYSWPPMDDKNDTNDIRTCTLRHNRHNNQSNFYFKPENYFCDVGDTPYQARSDSEQRC